MPSLPRIGGHDAAKAFQRAGFGFVRQKGSHVILRNPETGMVLSIPVHAGKTVGPGLLRSLIKDSRLTVDAFLGFLKD